MKKIILFLSLASFFLVWNSFAKTISIGDVNNWDVIILDEGENTISKNDATTHLFIPNSTNSTNPNPQAIFWGNNDIEIECKNWYFANVVWGNSGGDNGSNRSFDFSPYMVDTLDLWKNPGWNNTFAKIKCKPITSPVELVKAPDINYETINTSDPFSSGFSISKDNIVIDWEDIQSQLAPNTEISNQPTFLDVLYLQLKTISYLNNSLLLKNPDANISDLFYKNDSVDKFDEYSRWINKFSFYDTKKQFQDAFSGAVTLKDVWIAQDVISGLYTCLNNEDFATNPDACKGIINFKSVDKKTDVYKLKEIEDKLYGDDENSILNTSMVYYDRLKDTCSNINTTDTFIKTQLEWMCNLLLSDVDDISTETSFDLWYALETRLENLNNIKENIPQGGLNLKWIYNVYWELNNLTLWNEKLEIVDKIKNETDLQKQYELLNKAISEDVDELSSLKVLDSDLLQKANLLKEIINIDNKDILDTVSDTNILNYDNVDLIEDNDGKKSLKVGDVILSMTDYELLWASDYNSNASDYMKLKDSNGNDYGKVIYNRVNTWLNFNWSNCSYEAYFPDEFSSNACTTWKVGGLEYEFVDNKKFAIGNKTWAFVYLKTGSYNDDSGLRYTDLKLWSSFRIEIWVRWGALKRTSNKYVLFKQPFWKHLELALNNGNLELNTYELGVENCGKSNAKLVEIPSSPIIKIDSGDLEKLDKDTYYKISVVISNYSVKINITDYNNSTMKIFAKTENVYNLPHWINRLSIWSSVKVNKLYVLNESKECFNLCIFDYSMNIDTNWHPIFDSDIKNGNEHQWNDIIDYIKIYKEVTQ